MDNIDSEQGVPPLWEDPHANHMHYWFDAGELGLKRGLCVLPPEEDTNYLLQQRARFNMASINILVKLPEEPKDA